MRMRMRMQLPKHFFLIRQKALVQQFRLVEIHDLIMVHLQTFVQIRSHCHCRCGYPQSRTRRAAFGIGIGRHSNGRMGPARSRSCAILILSMVMIIWPNSVGRYLSADIGVGIDIRLRSTHVI